MAPDGTLFYTRNIEPDDRVRIVESEIDLYWQMALDLYLRIERNNAADRDTVCIVPVGPTFQYRRFVWLMRERQIDLSRLFLFFMDEYLTDDGGLIAPESPLSFRGFVRRELVEPLGDGGSGFRAAQVFFPDPADPSAYDHRLHLLGGAEVCYAGVGINGHLAFNEPPDWEDPAFESLPTRVVDLSPHTITINSNTALGGAWDQIPKRAITVGMGQILASRELRIYLNRPWQRAVVRKLLWGPVTARFPASYAQRHPNATVTMTREVAAPPDFGLR